MQKLLIVSIVLAAMLFLGFAPVASAQTTQPTVSKCDPFINALASFVIPGWGQWLNGQRHKAMTFFGVAAALDVATILLRSEIAMLTGIASAVWGIYAGWDAFSVCAGKYPAPQKAG